MEEERELSGGEPVAKSENSEKSEKVEKGAKSEGLAGRLEKRGINAGNTARFCATMLALIAAMAVFVKTARLFAPLIVAVVISAALEPVVKRVMKHIRLRRAFAGPAVIVALLAVVFLILWATASRLLHESVGLFSRMPEYVEALYGNIEEFAANNSGLLDWLPAEFDVSFAAIAKELSDWAAVNAQEAAEFAVKSAIATAARAPNAALFMITAMISTFFIIIEREKHAAFVARNAPQKWIEAADRIRRRMFDAAFGYVRAQLLIMVVIFAILVVGLYVASVPYALFVALFAALLDALPVLGIGLILLPWAAYSFIAGDVFLGTTLMILFVVCNVARRLIEPKILSKQVGADPLMTVTAMFLGFRLFGVAGLVTGPIAYILIRMAAVSMFDGRSFKEYFLLEKDVPQ